MNLRLFGTFTLRSPLSHIGESISTVSYLVQEPILQDDGTIEEVAVYSGNAWRGQLRDRAAEYMLHALGDLQVPLETFHLLFSGGRIGGAQVVDVERARLWRRAIPMFALWGGGIGNQVLPGKLRVANCYPICREAIPVLPPQHHVRAERTSYRALTFEKNFSRKDDGKDDRLRVHIVPPVAQAQQGQLLLRGTDEAREPRETKRREPADQMRMSVELLAAGTMLVTEVDLLAVHEVELGAFVSAIHQWSLSPFIGGQANKGHGRANLHYELLNLDTGEVLPFVDVTDGPALLALTAQDAKDAYDVYVRQMYDAHLAAHATEIHRLLGLGAS